MTHGYCPSCEQNAAIDENCCCLWCGASTEEEREQKPWRKPRTHFTDAQLCALHVMHLRGASVNQLAKQVYKLVGYKTHNSAHGAIRRGWRGLGLRPLSRIESARRASTKHGLAPKHGPRPGYAKYRRVVLNGEEDRRCAGVKQHPPHKGDPCDRSPGKGSEFCTKHDPQRRAETMAIIRSARDRLPKPDMVPMAPLTEWLCLRRGQLGTWVAVADSIGKSVSMVHAYGNGLSTAKKEPKEAIGRETVERFLCNAGVRFEDLYGVMVR